MARARSSVIQWVSLSGPGTQAAGGYQDIGASIDQHARNFWKPKIVTGL